MVDSANIPTSHPYPRDSTLAFYPQSNWKDDESNPADVLSKHWESASIFSAILGPAAFLKGRYM